MKEETGLTIYNPKLVGIKNFMNDDDSRYMVLLYKTDSFEGELKSSNEGDVFWVEKDKLSSLNLMWETEEIIDIYFNNTHSELFYDENDNPVLK